ncbi:MAG TPA: TonB-dependent hemoglobin/transferrin/lactoferrin family receptor [Hydrogenophaga sp.]|uniref:TonB-dependent hemoglobin/transferrin/lactoferrin family receptor n=1 Tax=Hydrogenophaga sp. TaxID=1904254 RepID=UPI002C3165D7|nr:TonB-dependent hemoglobin/transferrin/lactoferrin family receptor [Hydrogenophaga sp.]HSX93209.1 TonB-dependent hemoglobin/transferrin/lactoferrin family receptor [Hydrogenophaga sp.]
MPRHFHFTFPAFHPVALACALLAAAPALAQTPTSGATTTASAGSLKPVVISGSRSERALDDVPARIDVIEGEALDPTRAQDIRELVRELPNVEVRRAPQRFGAVTGSTGRDGNAGFNIRGLDGNRVLLTVDGIRMPRELNNQVFGAAAFGRDYYDLGLISRVEILRGAASALYGSDGLAGMVSMTTTAPKDLLKDGQTFGGRVGVRTDTEDESVGTGVTLAGIASERLQWLGSVQVGRAKALDNQGENHSLNSNRTAPNPQKDKSVSALGKIILTPGGGQTHTFAVEHVDKETEVEGYTGRSPSASGVQDLDGTSEMQRTRVSWDGRFQLQSIWADSLRATVGYQQSESREWSRELRTAVPNVRERDVTYTEDLWQAVLQAERTRSLGHGWAHTLVYGADVSVAELDNLVTGVAGPAYETYPLQRFPKTRETNSALFVQSEFVSERWSLIPALRYDRFSLKPQSSPLYPLEPAELSDSALSPKLGLIFRPQPHWQVFANAAAGFKAPSPLQLNNFFQNALANYRTLPNPDLKPETSQTLELGARGEQGRFNWLATAFTGRYKDFIEDNVRVGGTGAPGNPILFQAVNRGRVKLSGFELEGRWAATPATTLKLAYGQTRGRDTLLNQPLNSVNPAKLVMGVDHRIADWTLGAVLTHAAAKDDADINRTNTPQQFATPSWTTLDLRATWRITPATRLSAAVHNVTDRKYWLWSSVQGVASNLATLDAYTSPGRSLSVALVTDF